MSAKAVVRMPGEGKQVTLAGKPMTFLVTGEEPSTPPCSTGRCRRIFDGPSCSSSSQEETFYVLEGECQWQVGDQTIRATPGTYLFIPPGVPHNIANASDKPARMIMTVSPPGHEHYFEELVTPVARSSPPDANAIAELRSRYAPSNYGVEGTKDRLLIAVVVGSRPWAAPHVRPMSDT